MPVPVELLRFFDKFTPPAPAGGRESAADSASLADFGDEDMAEAEAEIASGAPLEIPEVPPIPELPMQVSDGKLAAAADAAAVPEPDAVARHDDTAADSGTYAPPPDPEGTRSWLGNLLAGRAGVVPAAQHAWPPHGVHPPRVA